jgi:serine/threonine protein kinase
VLGIARQVSEALAVAHAAQIVHRDIKPDNVMVRPDGYVKLLDFGLAKVQPDALGVGGIRPHPEAGLLLGTVAYMAPEQARGELITQEADVFALGVMLYELVTGRHPFLTSSQMGTLHALMWESPEPPSFVNPDLPRAIDQLIVEMLQKDPRLRPGASEVMYPPQPRTRLDGRGHAVGGHRSAGPPAGGARDRRARSGARGAAATSSSGRSAARGGCRDLRRSGDGQDDAGRDVFSSS